MPLTIDVGGATLHGDLTLPADAIGVVVFARTSEHGAEADAIARTLQDFRFGTLLFDLLADGEEQPANEVDLLTRRLLHVLDDLTRRESTANLPVGLMGAADGAAAIFASAAAWPEEVRAVVARSGRPDLAGEVLPRVTAPTLMIVGGKDPDGQRVNEEAAQRLAGPAEVRLVPGATREFEEPGTLESAAELAGDWFTTHLR